MPIRNGMPNEADDPDASRTLLLLAWALEAAAPSGYSNWIGCRASSPRVTRFVDWVMRQPLETAINGKNKSQ